MAERSGSETLLTFAAEPFEVFHDRQHPRLRHMAVALDRRFRPDRALTLFHSSRPRRTPQPRSARPRPSRGLARERSSMTSCSVIPPYPCAAVFRSSRAPSEVRTNCTYHFAQVARSTKPVPATFDRLAPPVIGSPPLSYPDSSWLSLSARRISSAPSRRSTRPQTLLYEWLHRIAEELAAHIRDHPYRPAAPFAVNQIVHTSSDRLEDRSFLAQPVRLSSRRGWRPVLPPRSDRRGSRCRRDWRSRPRRSCAGCGA